MTLFLDNLDNIFKMSLSSSTATRKRKRLSGNERKMIRDKINQSNIRLLIRHYIGSKRTEETKNAMDGQHGRMDRNAV